MDEDQNQRIQELFLLQRVAQKINSILDLDVLLEAIVNGSDECVARGIRNLSDPSTSGRSLLDDVSRFIKGYPATDDITVVTIQTQ